MIQAKEGEICWLPSTLIHEDIAELPSSVSIHLGKQRVGLLFNGVVGSLSITREESIAVASKFGETNFLHMLFVAEGNQNQLQNLTKSLAWYGLDDQAGINGLLIGSLLELTDRTLTSGLRQIRSPITIADSSIRGRINFLKTVTNISSGATNPVVQIVKQRNFDTPENRIVLYALYLIGNQISPSYYPIWRELLKSWKRRSGATRLLESDLQNVKKGMSAKEFRGSRSIYESLVGTALILLSQQGLTLNSVGQIQGDSLLISTASVFEKYLRKIIAELRSPFSEVVTGPDRLHMYLYDDSSFSINPDIIIWKDGKPSLLIDAKYKEPTSADHYQMLTYLHRFNLPKGYLISPTTGSSFVRSYTQSNESKVIELRINISNIDDVPDQIRRLSNSDI